MTQLAPPVLTAVSDGEAAGGDELDVTFTPGITGDTRIDTRRRDELAWVTAGTFAGVAGTPLTVTVTGLRPGFLYEVIAYSDNGTDFSNPSIPRRGVPSDGSEPQEVIMMQRLKTELEGIRVANGFYTDVSEVFLYEEIPEEIRSSPSIWVEEVRDDSLEDSNLGPFALVNQFKTVRVSAWSTNVGRTRREGSKESKRLFDAITKAIFEGNQNDLGGTCIKILHKAHEYVWVGGKHPWAGCVAEYEFHWRHRANNPSVRQ